MKFKAPKPIASEDAVLLRAEARGDHEVLDRAAQYLIDELAPRIETQADLKFYLEQIPDPEQRYIVMDRLSPLLKFKPEGLVKETA